MLEQLFNLEALFGLNLMPETLQVYTAVLGSAIAAATSLGTAAIGAMSGGGGGGGLSKAALEYIKGIRVPTPQEQAVILEELKRVGLITPEEEFAIAQGQTNLANIQIEPRLKQAQMNALARMQQVGEEGLTVTDRAAINLALSETNQAARGREEAIIQDMARKGMLGSGMELAARQASGQQAASEASRQGFDTAALSRERALQAIMQSGELAGQQRDQSFGEQAKVAEAKDIRDRFNIENRRDVQQRNVAARNMAQAANLAEDQRIADSNVGIRNLQEEQQKGLIGQYFQDQLAKGQAMSGTAGQADQMAAQQAKTRAESMGRLIEGAGTAAKGAADYFLKP